MPQLRSALNHWQISNRLDLPATRPWVIQGNWQMHKSDTTEYAERLHDFCIMAIQGRQESSYNIARIYRVAEPSRLPAITGFQRIKLKGCGSCIQIVCSIECSMIQTLEHVPLWQLFCAHRHTSYNSSSHTGNINLPVAHLHHC